MYINKFLPLVLVLIAFLFVGCKPTTVNINKQPEPVSLKYDIIEIPDFAKTDAEWVPYDSGSEIADMLAERFREDNSFKEIIRTRSAAREDRRVLVVDGTVTGYGRGCKYCEYIFRGREDKGKGSILVWVRLLDKTTGETITDVSIDGRAKPPGYGRSRYIRVVDQLVKMIEEVNGKS